MNTSHLPQSKHYTSWIVGIAVVVIIAVVIILVARSSRGGDPDTASIQEQIKKDPKLQEFVNSPRNDFSQGSYSIDSNASYVEWTYDGLSGKIPVTKGNLKAVNSGHIETFDATWDTGAITVEKGDASIVKNAINASKYDTAAMKALTILPNTTDDAFTVAFTLDAVGKSTSLATGLFVKNEGEQIIVSGDIYLDGKTVLTPAGFATDKSVQLKLNYVFKK